MLTSLPANLVNCDPAVAVATLVSLEPAAPLAFLGHFLSVGAPQGLVRLLVFP